jgi:hypothetical protein
MNLQCKRARIPIAALGVTALCTAGFGFLPSAVAAGTLALNPSATAINTLDLGKQISGGALDQQLADATFGINVTTTPSVPANGFQLVLDSYTAPSGVTPVGTPTLQYASTATGLATGPATGWAGLTKTTPGTTDVSTALQTGAGDAITYVTANLPGSYVAHFVDAGTSVGTDDDSLSPNLTFNVKDVVAATGATSDDWTPTVTVPTTAGIGGPVQANVSFADATLTDARGSSAGAGVLGAKLNPLVGVAFTGPAGLNAGDNAPTAGTFGTTSTTRSVPVGRTTAAGTLTTAVSFDKTGDGIGTGTDQALTTASTSVQSNGVDSVGSLMATDVLGAVKSSGLNNTTVSAKPSETTITYSAVVANSVTPTDVADKTVYFSVSSATPATLAKITADGTLVDTTSTTKVYSAKSDTNGKATLKVTTAGAAAADSYGVAVQSNGHDAAAPAALTTTYSAATASAVRVTSSASDLTVAAGSAVVVKGAVYDQFGAAVTPLPAASQQAQLFVGSLATTCNAGTAPAAGAATNTATQNATLSGGTFTFSYTPATTPTAGQCAAFRIGYDANGNGTIEAGESDTGSVNYASAADAAALSITAPLEAASVGIQHYGAISAGTAVSGVVTDAASATVAYKSVKLTGGDGVYFSTVASPVAGDPDDDLVKELTVVTNGSGAYSAYAFFTDAGSHKVTVTSGATATKSVNVTVADPTNADAYAVKVDDLAGQPGDTLIVTGKVTDMFGGPVPGANVNLDAGATTVGSLGDIFVQTNAQGVFSTTFSSGSNSKGDVELTATLSGQSQNRTAAVAWKNNAGLTFDAGVYQDTATISVANADLTLSAPDNVTASGNGAKFNLKGTFLPSTSVDIYGKVSGDSVYQLMGSKQTDEDGNYVFEVMPKVSTTYLAKSSGLSSGAESVTVWSKVSLKAKALGGGKVRLTANGDPNVAGPLKFYRSVAGKDPRVGSLTSSDGGVGSVTVKVSKGTRKFYATFDAPGTNMGTSKTVSVKVK